MLQGKKRNEQNGKEKRKVHLAKISQSRLLNSTIQKALQICKVSSLMKMHSLNHSISELPNYIKNGTEAQFKLGYGQNQLATNDKIKAPY